MNKGNRVTVKEAAKTDKPVKHVAQKDKQPVKKKDKQPVKLITCQVSLHLQLAIMSISAQERLFPKFGYSVGYKRKAYSGYKPLGVAKLLKCASAELVLATP